MTVTESLPFVDAVRRGLVVEEQDTQVRTALTLTTNIAESPAQLWPLLTRRSELARWYGRVTGELVEGGTFRVPSGAQCRVLEAAEPHKLSLTWDFAGSVDPVQIRLDPEDDGTTSLRISHTTMIPREVFDRYGAGAAAISWEIALLSLASVTDGWRTCGVPDVPFPSPEWLQSVQGSEHVRAWSVRWAAQAVAAGVDEAVARRAETETVRAFSSGDSPLSP